MKNLEQVRAARALADEKNTTKRDVAKLPALIINNGLLAAAAFATETNDRGKPKRKGMMEAMNSVAAHLGTMPGGIPAMKDAKSAGELVQRLTSQNAGPLDLQRATDEALAYISYLKRFATKAGEEQPAED